MDFVIKLYVSPNGNDTWSGLSKHPAADSTDGPLATVIGARNRLRQLRGEDNVSAVVEIADGFYSMSEPLVLTRQDGATGETSVAYVAAPDARPILSGGMRLNGWKANDDGTWSTKAPVAWNFSDLYVDGKRATPARLPKTNHFEIPKSLDYTIDPYIKEAEDVDFKSFVVNHEDILPFLALPDNEKRKVTVEAFHAWQTTVNYIDSVTQAPDGTWVLTLKGDGYNNPYYDRAQFVNDDGDYEDIGTPVHARRYILHNISSALEAGEWYQNPNTGIVTYKPHPDEFVKSARIVAPRLDQLLVVQGTTGSPAENIRFEGLSFRHARYILDEKGAVSRGSSKLPSSILVNQAKNIVFSNVQIAYTGANGIWFNRNTEGCVLKNSYVFQIGGTGVRLGQVDSEPDQIFNIKGKDGLPNPSDYHVVHDNVITGMGQTYKNAHGVLIGFSGYNSVTHNDISDMYRDAIMVGGTISPYQTRTHSNLIAYNNLHNIGKGVLSDLGAVHFFGPQPNTIFDHNRIYNVKRYAEGYPGFGIYADNMTSFVTFTNNIVYDCEETLMLNCTRELTIINNILVNSDPQPYTYSAIGRGRTAIRISNKRMTPSWTRRGGFVDELAYLNNAPGFWFENNIVVNSGDNFLLSPSFQWARDLCSNENRISDEFCLIARNTVIKNLYYRIDGPGLLPGPHAASRYTFAKWQEIGYDAGSVEANPQFVDDKYQLLAVSSPAQGLGFVPIDTSQIGPVSKEQKLLVKKISSPQDSGSV